MRTLDDCYGAEYDRFPLEQESSPPAPLSWEEPGDAAESRAEPAPPAAM